MKIDTSQPKDWKKFISALGVTGIEKLILTNCTPEVWQFPRIVLSLSPAQVPFFSKERVEHLRIVMSAYFDFINVDLKILVRAPGSSDVLDEIQSRIKLEEKPNQRYLALCPFHEEKTSSFMVDMKVGIWHCFGCGKHGKAETLCKTMDLEEERKKTKEKSKGRLAIENLDEISNAIVEDLSQDGASSLPYNDLLKYFDVYLKISKVKKEIYDNENIHLEDAL